MKQESESYINYKIAVPKAYEEVFSHFYFAENYSNHTIKKTLFPSYQTILIFNFGKNALLHTPENCQIEIDKCTIFGPIKKAFDYSLLPHSKILVANFKDDAFYRFFGNASLTESFLINPDELLNENCFTFLWYELNKINTVTKQVDYMLEFCKPYLKQRNIITEQLINFDKKSLNPIKIVADNNCQTERNIQINQKKHFGYSVKEMNRYQRFLKVIEYLKKYAVNSSKPDWFLIINECGYYDQSQLIKDFKHYINITPSKYLKFQQDICNPNLDKPAKYQGIST